MLKMWTNDVDTLIAENEEEAAGMLQGMYSDEEISVMAWDEILPDEELELFWEPTGKMRKHTVQEWINEIGKGYFACDY